MIKIKFIQGWMIIGLLFGFSFSLIAQTKTVNLEPLTRIQKLRKGQVYEIVSVKNSTRSKELGRPNLPMLYYTFFVPNGQQVSDVVFTSMQTEELILSHKMDPLQKQVFTGSYSKDSAFVEPDETVYKVNSYYPARQAKVFQTDFSDFDLQLVTVQVCPVQYNPVTNKMKFFNEFNIKLITEPVAQLNTKNTLKVRHHSKWRINMVKPLVENPQDLPAPDTIIGPGMKPSTLKSATVSWSIPFYEYVIITTKALKPAFTELVAWKKRKGYNAGIVCIEDILNNAMATGDPVSPTCLNDYAGDLRRYLYDGYNAEITTYALLAGDNIPIRYGYYANYSPLTPGVATIPSDLYFSDFLNNWCIIGINNIGAHYPTINYGSQIFVGRLICSTLLDVQNYTYKILKYEQNPGNGDNSYLMKSFMTQADHMQAGRQYYDMGDLPELDQAEIVASHLPQFTHTIFSEKPLASSPNPTNMNDFATYANYATPLFPKGAEVISQLNTHYGLFSVLNHGSQNSFASATAGLNGGSGTPLHRYQVTSSDSYIDYEHISPESGNGFDNLSNYDYPTILYSQSCVTMPFDNWGLPSGSRNMGVSFTVANKGGGPAYLGNTRDGIWICGYLLENKFADLLGDGNTPTNVGVLEANSKFGFSDFIPVLSHNLIGCPEMPMWTALPTLFNGSVSENGTSVTVNTGGVVAEKICIMSALNDGYWVVKPNLSSYTFTGVSKPYYVTITKTNYIPFRNSLTNVYVQHKNLSSTAYLNCQTVSAGYNVNASDTLGNVIIKSGANITFDATGDILLSNGFEVELGATFEAK